MGFSPVLHCQIVTVKSATGSFAVDGFFDRPVQLALYVLIERHQLLDKLALPVEHKRLRNARIFSQELIDERIVGRRDRIIYLQPFLECGHLRPVLFSADVKPDDLKSFVAIFCLK